MNMHVGHEMKEEIKARRARLGYVQPVQPIVPVHRIRKEIAPIKIEVILDPTAYEHRVTYRATTKALAKIVADHYKIDVADMLGPRRLGKLLLPRHITYYLARNIFKQKSLPQIGKDMGERDHTTILHGIRKIEELIKKDKALADTIFYLEQQYKQITTYHVYWGA